MGVSSGARANPLTGAGRHRLAQVALAHPVRTVILVHLVSRIVAWLVAAGAVLALFLHWLPVLPQRNVHWIALLLPIHLALAWTLAVPARRR